MSHSDAGGACTGQGVQAGGWDGVWHCWRGGEETLWLEQTEGGGVRTREGPSWRPDPPRVGIHHCPCSVRVLWPSGDHPPCGLGVVGG